MQWLRTAAASPSNSASRPSPPGSSRSMGGRSPTSMPRARSCRRMRPSRESRVGCHRQVGPIELEREEVGLLGRLIQKLSGGGSKEVVTKRDVSDKERAALADRGQAMPDGSFPIASKEDLANAIQAHGRAN